MVQKIEIPLIKNPDLWNKKIKDQENYEKTKEFKWNEIKRGEKEIEKSNLRGLITDFEN